MIEANEYNFCFFGNVLPRGESQKGREGSPIRELEVKEKREREFALCSKQIVAVQHMITEYGVTVFAYVLYLYLYVYLFLIKASLRIEKESAHLCTYLC